ncbi:MAG: T9SS type A sorting domain-containing protein, partial [Calditrichaeota bacterium]|nr:T9SS type A sorting domain-containing protein [Calditrichota bacterium]
RVLVRVFDVSGRVVAALYDGEQTAGHHSVVWNAKGMSAGVYLVRMESAGFSAIRKVTLMK